MKDALSQVCESHGGVWSLTHDFYFYALLGSSELCPLSLILNEHMTNLGQGTVVEVTLCDRGGRARKEHTAFL